MPIQAVQCPVHNCGYAIYLRPGIGIRLRSFHLFPMAVADPGSSGASVVGKFSLPLGFSVANFP